VELPGLEAILVNCCSPQMRIEGWLLRYGGKSGPCNQAALGAHTAALLLALQAVTAALPSLKAAAPPGVRIGGYANGFQTTTSGVCSGVRIVKDGVLLQWLQHGE